MRAIVKVLTLWIPAYMAFWFLVGITGFARTLSVPVNEMLDILFLATIADCVVLMPYFIWRISRREDLEAKGPWVVGILVAPVFYLPYYLLKYEKPPESEASPGKSSPE